MTSGTALRAESRSARPACTPTKCEWFDIMIDKKIDDVVKSKNGRLGGQSQTCVSGKVNLGKGRDENVKERIIDAGITLFLAYGFAGTPIKNLTDAAGVAKGMLNL